MRSRQISHLLVRSAVFSATFFITNFAALKTDNFNDGPILCTFRRVTGLPCPFCGTTRAFGELAQGNLISSLTLNPLALVLTALALLWVLQPRLLQMIKDRIVQFWWRITEGERVTLAFIVFVSFWLANLPRMLNA